jgi:Pyruvate/2-oxoacid:ferredoxin oxidoreductase gamma subunit
MTLTEAAARVGRYVGYQAHHNSEIEWGVVERVGEVYAYVRFDGDLYPKACRPGDLFYPPDSVVASRNRGTP